MENELLEIHWTPETRVALIEAVGEEEAVSLTKLLDHGKEHYREFKYLEARSLDSKKRAQEAFFQVLPFLDGKAQADEGSFTLGYPPPRKTLDGEALKIWLVERGVSPELVAEGVAACTKTGKPGAPFVKWNPRRAKGGKK